METDYGSEAGWRTPWEIFDEEDAQQSVDIAKHTVQLATQMLDAVRSASDQEMDMSSDLS